MDMQYFIVLVVRVVSVDFVVAFPRNLDRCVVGGSCFGLCQYYIIL